MMIIKIQEKIKNKKVNNQSTVLRDSESQLHPSTPLPFPTLPPLPSTPPLPAEWARDDKRVIRWPGEGGLEQETRAGDLGRRHGQV